MNEREKFSDTSLPHYPTVVSDRNAQCLHRKGGADSVVFLLSNGRVLKEYHQLERRCPGRAKEILEQYCCDTVTVARYVQAELATFSRNVTIDGQTYCVVPRAALQGREVRVSAAGVPYMVIDEYVSGPTLKDLMDGSKVFLERSQGLEPYCLDLSSDRKSVQIVRQALRNTLRKIDQSASQMIGRSLGIITTNAKVHFDTVNKRVLLIITDLVFDIGDTYKDFL